MGNSVSLETSIDSIDFANPHAFYKVNELSQKYSKDPTELAQIIQKLNYKFNHHCIDNPISFQFVNDDSSYRKEEYLKPLLLECISSFPSVLIDIILDYSNDYYLLLVHDFDNFKAQYSKLYLAEKDIIAPTA